MVLRPERSARCRRSPRHFRPRSRPSYATRREAGAAGLAEIRAQIEGFPRHAALKRVLGRKGVPVGPGVRPPLRDLTADEAARLDAWLENAGVPG